MKVITSIFILLIVCVSAEASETYKRIVDISVNIDSTTDHKVFILSWDNSDSNAASYIIRRKLKTDNQWTFIAEISADEESEINDRPPDKFNALEYSIVKTTKDSSYNGYGYVYTGYDVKMPLERGIVLLLVDENVNELLPEKIERMEADLIGDGYTVIKRPVERVEKFNPAAVSRTKSIIEDIQRRYPEKTITVIILGRVAVPYSGDSAWDGHQPDHTGSWPADVYYGTERRHWLDNNIYNTSPVREENKNIPFDGKFDNSVIINSKVQIGRIDMYNLPDFKETEIELLARYLDKNHAYRHKLFTMPARALLDDGFKTYLLNEAFAASGWMNFSALLGSENIDTLSFRYVLPDSSYLWAYGCNSGAYTNIYNTVYTGELAQKPYRSVFTLLLGSYAGDWDTENNVLRATLASRPSMLATIWSGRPFWFFHQMALGEPIGFCALISQNNRSLYQSTGNRGLKGAHMALLGDPTLRMVYPAPPQQFTVVGDTNISNKRFIGLKWNKPDDNILGYYLFRSDSIHGRFELLSDDMLFSTEYIDSTAMDGDFVYMLRSVKRELAVTGTYYNLSQGVFAEVKKVITDIDDRPAKNVVKIFPNPAKENVFVKFYCDYFTAYSISVSDVSGRVVFEQSGLTAMPGENIFEIDLSSISVGSGVYFVKIQSTAFIYFGKLTIIN